MTAKCTGNESASAYASSEWRQAFCLLEPLVGRSISEVLIEDLHDSGVDVCRDGTYISVAEVKKTPDGLFGDGSSALLDYLERRLKSAKS